MFITLSTYDWLLPSVCHTLRVFTYSMMDGYENINYVS